MSQAVLAQIAAIEARATAAIAAAAGFDALHAVERAELDKGGELEQILRKLRELPEADRKTVGAAGNSLKRRLLEAIAARKAALEQADVAASLGFVDQAHLTRRFKAAYGMTPGRYRASRLRC